MKKILSVVLVFALCFTFTAVAFAAEPQEVLTSQTIQHLSDDAYVVISVYETPSSPLLRSAYTKYAHKDADYYLNGSLQWTFTVHGEFLVDTGVSVTATNSGYAFTPNLSGWSLSYGTSSRNGATASASGTVVGSRTVYPAVSVSCDKNGNIS